MARTAKGVWNRKGAKDAKGLCISFEPLRREGCEGLQEAEVVMYPPYGHSSAPSITAEKQNNI